MTSPEYAGEISDKSKIVAGILILVNGDTDAQGRRLRDN